MPLLFKALLATAVILFAAWLSAKKPVLAGFITALPLVSILALAFSYQQTSDTANTAQYARSIMLAIPFSWAFFVPFFVGQRWGLSFWQMWGLGLVLILISYGLYRLLFAQN